MAIWIETTQETVNRRAIITGKIESYWKISFYRSKFPRKYLRRAFDRIGKLLPAVLYHQWSIKRRTFAALLIATFIGGEVSHDKDIIVQKHIEVEGSLGRQLPLEEKLHELGQQQTEQQQQPKKQRSRRQKAAKKIAAEVELRPSS